MCISVLFLKTTCSRESTFQLDECKNISENWELSQPPTTTKVLSPFLTSIKKKAFIKKSIYKICSAIYLLLELNLKQFILKYEC